MQILTASDTMAAASATLGLGERAAFDSPAFVAESLRRAASLLCPCSPRTLVDAVATAAKGLVSSIEEYHTAASDVLQALVAHGDLLEVTEATLDDRPVSAARLLYLAPPGFVLRGSGSAILIGVVPDEVYPIPDDLRRRVTHNRHVRSLVPADGEDLRALLTGMSLRELRMDEWIGQPRRERPKEYLGRINEVLDLKAGYVALENLQVIDPLQTSTYYRGRWRSLDKDTGRFIGRRPQAFGAALWCYVETENGRPLRLLDLPWDDPRVRGCDEAWRLQMAIDAVRSAPQQFRIVQMSAGQDPVMQFFSPVPAWAVRRWEAVGEPADANHCLFAYRFREAEIQEEATFAREELWLAELQ